ncbi:hypothetical protein [Chitinophaga sp. MM2321]|uniref:hypothetical protein n=1 Tax=Chitinophaga sp. MM2321 TaxID=3137178 RepID=UPI0032D58418
MSVKAGLGAGRMIKSVLLTTVPSGVVTAIFPLTAWSETVALILVALVTSKLAASLFPNFTSVAPVKFVPVIITDSPWQMLTGEKEVIVGGCG